MKKKNWMQKNTNPIGSNPIVTRHPALCCSKKRFRFYTDI